jgi:tRNA(Ile)-lysidine synthase
MAERYPVPGPAGGKLIRRVIGALRGTEIPLPLNSHILLAASGGADSTALALLLARYGRRVAAPSGITLLHVDHAWRGRASREDARFVRGLAAQLGTGFREERLPGPAAFAPGDSWEDAARDARKGVYARIAREMGRGTLVLTAHHGDDVAETMLWRLFTGTSRAIGAGVLARDGVEVRPLLDVRKRELLAFLEEEGQAWREDSTNADPRFLRARIRSRILPAIEEAFPRATDHLMARAAEVRMGGPEREDEAALQALFGASGARPRRAHWEAALRESPEIHLPGGWRLRRDEIARPALTNPQTSPKLRKGTPSTGRTARWILEKTHRVDR